VSIRIEDFHDIEKLLEIYNLSLIKVNLLKNITNFNASLKQAERAKRMLDFSIFTIP
jgi:hypothetical protein